MRRIKLLLLSAVLPMVALSAPAPPLCQVQVVASPDYLDNFFQVTVKLRDSCPVAAIARVRLESYVGGHYPRGGWFMVTKAGPLRRGGIPWYWRVAIQNRDGSVSYQPIRPVESP